MRHIIKFLHLLFQLKVCKKQLSDCKKKTKNVEYGALQAFRIPRLHKILVNLPRNESATPLPTLL